MPLGMTGELELSCRSTIYGESTSKTQTLLRNRNNARAWGNASSVNSAHAAAFLKPSRLAGTSTRNRDPEEESQCSRNPPPASTYVR